MRLELRPISVKAASAFVTEHHRHHCAPQGAKFALSAWRDGQLVGVAMVGRPVSRMLTYTLDSESGASLRAVGWNRVGVAGGRSWSRPARRREDSHPIQPKIRWEATL